MNKKFQIFETNPESEDLSGSLGISDIRMDELGTIVAKHATHFYATDDASLTKVLEDSTKDCNNINEVGFVCFKLGFLHSMFLVL